MDKNIEKVIEIMNEEFEKNNKSYYIIALEFGEDWEPQLTVSWTINTNELIVWKYMIDKHIDSQISLNE